MQMFVAISPDIEFQPHGFFIDFELKWKIVGDTGPINIMNAIECGKSYHTLLHSLCWCHNECYTSQITGASIVSIVSSGADQRKRQSSASLAFCVGNHRWPVASPHNRPVTLKMFDDVIMHFRPHKRLMKYHDTVFIFIKKSCSKMHHYILGSL